MAFTKIIGFETGDTKQLDSLPGTPTVQSTTKRTGGYALKVNPSGVSAQNGVINTASEFAARFYFYAASIQASAEICFGVDSSVLDMTVRLNGNGTLEAIVNTISKGVSAAISAATWYRIDIKWITGSQAISLNGTQFATDTQAATAISVQLGKINDLNGNTVEYYYDDFVLTNASAAYPIGAGQSIARQPGAGLGTPTYNSWTKSTGTDAGALWDNTPFTTGDFNSAASSVAQTSFVSPFSSGTNAIGASDTINAAQVGLIAKTSATSSSGNTLTIRRRVSGADTDTALTTVTTVDAFFAESTLWTATLTNLDGMQAGAVVTAGTRTRTVEDVWIFVDYTPPSSSIKTIDGLARASVKTVDALALASMKTWNGLA